MITEDVRFKAEVIPDSLRALGDQLATFFGVSVDNVGMKGNPEHRRGYHRSRRFLVSSPYSHDRHYSVTDAPGNAGGDPNWICALDIKLPAPDLIAMCKRLDVAVRAGKLEKLAEWFGNDDGDNRVDGWDNIRNVVASSDPSHLWHAHLGLIRARAGEDHSDLFAILTGQEQQEDDVDQKTADAMLTELQALNEFLQTGRRYGKAATAPPSSEYIGTLHKLLGSIDDRMAAMNQLLTQLAGQNKP